MQGKADLNYFGRERMRRMEGIESMSTKRNSFLNQLKRTEGGVRTVLFFQKRRNHTRKSVPHRRSTLWFCILSTHGRVFEAQKVVPQSSSLPSTVSSLNKLEIISGQEGKGKCESIVGPQRISSIALLSERERVGRGQGKNRRRRRRRRWLWG